MLNTELFRYALTLAELGYSSIPCNYDKTPACRNGYKDATCDPAVLQKLWNNTSATLIGVPTGIVSDLSVLDIDVDKGGLDWLNINKPNLPPTRIHTTRSGGFHYLFRYKKGLRNSASLIAPGVDVRAEGGYIIWWPVLGLSVYDNTLATWPEYLSPSCKKQPLIPKWEEPIITSAYVAQALRNTYDRISNAQEGCRNETLNNATWSITRLCERGLLTPQTVINTVTPAALAAGLSLKEITATIHSVFAARRLS